MYSDEKIWVPTLQIDVGREQPFTMIFSTGEARELMRSRLSSTLAAAGWRMMVRDGPYLLRDYIMNKTAQLRRHLLMDTWALMDEYVTRLETEYGLVPDKE